MMRIGLLAAATAALLALSACGEQAAKTSSAAAAPSRPATTAARPARPNPFPEDPGLVERTTTERERRDLASFKVDLRRLRAAAAAAPGRSLKGTPGVRRATDLFLEHLNRSPLDLVIQNRLIDHAAAAVAFPCEQCFQQLEANRLIVAIAH